VNELPRVSRICSANDKVRRAGNREQGTGNGEAKRADDLMTPPCYCRLDITQATRVSGAGEAQPTAAMYARATAPSPSQIPFHRGTAR